MKFEDEVKVSKPFSSEAHKASLNVVYTGNVLLDTGLQVFKKYKLNDQHFNILNILKGRYPNSANPGEIKEVLMNKRGDLTRLLDKLHKMELIERTTNAKNRRLVDLSINEKGLSLIAEILPQLQEIHKESERLTESEAKQLNLLLDKLRG